METSTSTDFGGGEDVCETDGHGLTVHLAPEISIPAPQHHPGDPTPYVFFFC